MNQINSCRAFWLTAIASFLLAACSLACAQTKCVGGPLIAGAIAPAPRLEGKGIYESWLRQHIALKQQTAMLETDLYIAGDSLAAAWPTRFISAREPSLHTLNIGIGGDTAENLAWRIDDSTFRANPRGSTFLVLVGTNDLGGPACDVVQGIHLVVNTIRTKMPSARIIVSAIFPRGPSLQSFAGKIAAINAQLRALAPRWQVTVFDETSSFMCQVKLTCAYYSADMIHFTPAGYEFLTGRLLKLLHVEGDLHG